MDLVSNIVISGDIGTGKTTLTKALANYLDWTSISAGEFIRSWYLEHHLPLEETDKVPEVIDRQLDADLLDKLKHSKQIVFEWRMGGALSQGLNQIYKILCTTSDQEIKHRVALREKQHPEIAWQKLKQRSQGLKIKFKQLYGIDNCFNPRFFNLVIDTSHLTPTQVLESVIQHLKTETNLLVS